MTEETSAGSGKVPRKAALKRLASELPDGQM